MKTIVLIGILLSVALSAAPRAAEGQGLLKAIKEQTRKKIATRKAQADSAAIKRVGQTVDSTLEKTGRGMDTVVNRAAGIADLAVDKTADAISAASRSLTGSDDDDALAAALTSGRAVLSGIGFEERTDVLAPDAEPHVARLARLLVAQTGTFVIEGHVEATGDQARDLELSQRRAAALKTRLVASGVPAERLFAMGLGAGRPPAGGGGEHAARMEIARVQ